ncbi:MAG: metallophosphoesterase family protein [Promethearchaeota archaeon]
MVKFGIISDTHITGTEDPEKIEKFLRQIRDIFSDVDEIIHAGDICNKNFLEELNKIAPVKCVRGNMDDIEGLDDFLKFSVGKFNIGVIHKAPENMEEFFKENNLHILIHGHSHQPIIQGTSYNTLILNSGSPTLPKAPPPKKGFKKPVARPSVLTLNIDDNGMISTFLINLKS